jgi:hypothetical protein
LLFLEKIDLDGSGFSMRIRIVLAPQNAGWVIGKMAHRLCDALQRLGCEADVQPHADPAADINHWMSFAFADGCGGTLNTMMVTHADDPFKVGLIRERVGSAIQMALCMSSHAIQELADLGVPEDRLWYILPALDAPLEPRRVRIGITTRVYDDGRKREAFLTRLAREMRLDRFHFDIFGAGWEKVADALVRAGATVHIDPGSDDWQDDYARIRAALPSFDYYLYLGMDEGSLGTLDAVSAGVKTIVTAQGFHLGLPGGITHPFTGFDELLGIFGGIDQASPSEHDRLAGWTWDTYAREHLGVWQAMLKHRGARVPRDELIATHVRGATSSASIVQGKIASNHWRFYARTLAPARIRGAVARLRWLQPLRRLIGH